VAGGSRNLLGRISRVSLLVAIASLVGASSASADTVFSDGFESGDFSAWSQVQTNVDGTASVQSTTVSTGSFAAQLSESSTPGSSTQLRLGS
jgi:spore coat protein U-like protein